MTYPQFEIDDEFDDIVAVVQDKLGGLDGSLCMCLYTKTTPNTIIPVKSWSSFRNIYRYLTDVLRLEKSHLGRQYPREWDFVWVRVLTSSVTVVLGKKLAICSNLVG